MGRLLRSLKGAMSRSELMEDLGIKHRVHFGTTYLGPALEAELVEMTIPDKPKSVLQKYRLTEKGKKWLTKEKKT